jgi:hypothetical protein
MWKDDLLSDLSIFKQGESCISHFPNPIGHENLSSHEFTIFLTHAHC